jgi:hypothetical protein
MSGIDVLAKSGLQQSGTSDYGSNMQNNRGIYPAIVVPYGTNDITEQNRIRVRIVSLDENGNIEGKKSTGDENYNNYSGKDRGMKDEELVLCVPLIPEFFHARPQVGEMVYVIIENPTDNSSVRYWIGPIISSKLKLNFQTYEDAVKIFNKTDFISNRKIDSSLDLNYLFPSNTDIAVQGRNDADLMLKNRELLLIAGKFDSDNFAPNTVTPSFLQLKQISQINNINNVSQNIGITHKIEVNIQQNDGINFTGTIIITELKNNFEIKKEFNSYTNKNYTIEWLNNKIKEAKLKYKGWSFTTNVDEYKTLPVNCNIKSANTPLATNSNEDLLQKYSVGNLVSTNINIYSPRGKFRGSDLKQFEKGEDLKSFGEFADTLHPSVLGDEIVRVLDLIIRVVLEHIHTPQTTLLQTALSDELKKYTVDGLLQNILSNHVRIN